MAFGGGVIDGRAAHQFGAFGDFAKPAGQTVYVTPGYLLNAAKRKYGRHIFVIGALESALADFWDNVETKAENFDKNQRPVEVSRVIVDITAKEHCNTGTIGNDTMEVTTDQQETRSEKKSYSLSFGKQSNWEFGGGLNIGASYFNTASASIGIQGKRSKGKWKSEEEGKEEERVMSQSYGVKASEIKVPPMTKVTVEITTYAVTYKLPVRSVFSAPVSSYIPFYYKGWLGNLCCAGAGPTFRKFGYVTATELFQLQNNFCNLGYCVQFTKDSELSYVAETVEMYKKEEGLGRYNKLQ